MTPDLKKRLRIAGHILALLWAGFWTWFGIASGIGEGQGTLGIIMHSLMPGLLFIAFAVAPWKWPRGGAAALILVGIIVAIGYPMIATNMTMMTRIFIVLPLGIPPLASGILLLLGFKSKPLPVA